MPTPSEQFKTKNLETMTSIKSDLVSSYTIGIIRNICLISNNISVQVALLTLFQDIEYIIAMFDKSGKEKKEKINARIDLAAIHIKVNQLDNGTDSDELADYISSFNLLSKIVGLFAYFSQ